MNIRRLNEAFTNMYKEETKKPLKESFETELKDRLETKCQNMLMSGVSNIKEYEIAFQDEIEKMFPDKSWWEVTDCDIFIDLFNNRDPEETVDNIIDQLKPEYKEVEEEEIVEEGCHKESVNEEINPEEEGITPNTIVTYEFPELTEDDIITAVENYNLRYNLRNIDALEDGDILLKGTFSDILSFAQNYLDYDLHPDYITIEESLNEEIDNFDDDELSNIYGGDRNICPECGSDNYHDGICYNDKCPAYDPLSQYFDYEKDESLKEDLNCDKILQQIYSKYPDISEEDEDYLNSLSCDELKDEVKNRGWELDEELSPENITDAETNPRKFKIALWKEIENDEYLSEAEKDKLSRKIYDIFNNAKEIKQVNDVRKIPNEVDGQKIKYRFSMPTSNVSFYYDPYQEYIFILTDGFLAYDD